MTVLSAVKLLIILTFLDSVFSHRPERHPNCNIGQFIPALAEKVGKTDLKVVYGNHEVKCGESVNLLMISNTPTISYDLTGKCQFATIIEISPDSTLFQSPFLYYLVHNIPVGKLRDGFRGKSQDIPIGGGEEGDYGARYLFSKNPAGSAAEKNRYVYFVYCQCHKISKKDIMKISSGFDREGFDIKEYAERYNLGNPRAGIYHVFDATGVPVPHLVDAPHVV